MTAARAIGVDLGGTNARAALVDFSRGEILADERAEVPSGRSPEVVAGLVANLVKRVAGDERLPVAVGIAAMLRDHQHVVNAPNLGWQEVDFGDALAKELG